MGRESKKGIGNVFNIAIAKYFPNYGRDSHSETGSF
jgi:hypothetical protein